MQEPEDITGLNGVIKQLAKRLLEKALLAEMTEHLGYKKYKPHLCKSWLVQNGVDLYVVQRILGHASSAMTQRYSHLVSENLRRGLDTLITAGDHKNDHSEQIV